MSNTEPFDTDNDDDVEDVNEAQGFDAFWAEQLHKEAVERGIAPTEVIRGVTVRVPQDLPMRFRAKARELRDQDGIDAFKGLLADLFGVDVLDAWDAAGMGAREFKTVLHWGMSHGEGESITWQDAYDAVMAKDEDTEGDAGKGKSSTRKSGRSASTGRSSKRTSTGSTGSTPTDSPA